MYVNFLYVLVLIDSYYRIGLEYIMFVFSDFEFIYLYLMRTRFHLFPTLSYLFHYML